LIGNKLHNKYQVSGR